MDERAHEFQIQAAWVQQVIAGLTALGMFAYFAAEVIRLGSTLYKEVVRRE